MEINATVDVGNNITGMLEQLAQQIGTTADKVYPWYVQQAYLEGVVTLSLIAGFLLVSTVVLLICAPRADFIKGNIYTPFTVIASIFAVFSFLGIPFEGGDAFRKIQNPNYYAVKMMTQDIGRLVRK